MRSRAYNRVRDDEGNEWFVGQRVTTVDGAYAGKPKTIVGFEGNVVYLRLDPPDDWMTLQSFTDRLCDWGEAENAKVIMRAALDQALREMGEGQP